MKPDVPKLSPGAIEVASLMRRHGSREMGRQLGCSEGIVRHTASGRSTPRARLRERLREVYAVAPESFEDATGTAPRLGQAGPSRPTKARGSPERQRPVKAVVGDAQAMAFAQTKGIEGDIARAKKAGATPRELASMRTSLNGAIRTFARLSGSYEVTESQIVRSLPWQRLVVLVRTVLEKHPAAARDLQTAMLAYIENR